METYFTYILFSKKTNEFYKGSTKNVVERIERHNKGRELATKHGVPWLLLWYTSKPTRADAFKLEFKLKNLSRKRLIEFMLKYKDDVASHDELLLIEQLS
ncbi:MAG: GIY-YIG nuclease family protein [Bacteroidia bacterium]